MARAYRNRSPAGELHWFMFFCLGWTPNIFQLGLQRSSNYASPRQRQGLVLICSDMTNWRQWGHQSNVDCLQNIVLQCSQTMIKPKQSRNQEDLVEIHVVVYLDVDWQWILHFSRDISLFHTSCEIMKHIAHGYRMFTPPFQCLEGWNKLQVLLFSWPH